jgi:hypothetical protein
MEIIPITVTQLKARNQSRHSFNLLNNTVSMLITDDDEAGGEDHSQSEENDEQPGYLKDVNDDAEEADEDDD